MADLIPDFVATRADLNIAEGDNIARAVPWAANRARLGGALVVLDYGFLLELHRRMFGDVWRWAGSHRRRGTNIGVDPLEIPMQTRLALDDGIYWHEHGTYETDELAVRLHHRLVVVHPFPNGNGRCTRLVADSYLTSIGAHRFTWGAGQPLEQAGEARRQYLGALHDADLGDFGPLTRFARS